MLLVSDLVLAKTFVAEPAAILVDLVREVGLAGVDPVAVVSLSGRDDSVVLREDGVALPLVAHRIKLLPRTRVGLENFLTTNHISHNWE